MAPPIVRFQFDPTGKDRNNRVPGEVCKLDTKTRRTIVPKYGAFYGDSVVLVDAYTLKPLDHGKHYIFDSLRQVITKRTGKGVYGVIVIIDPSVGDTVNLTYQAVGGAYMDHSEDVVQLSSRVSDDNRSVLYGNVDGIPDEFKPSMHFHDIGDFYNFDGLAQGMERLRMLHQLSVRLSADSIYAYVESELTALSQNGASTMADLLAQHNANQDAHPQYVKTVDIGKYIAPLRTPSNVVPANGQKDVALDVSLQAGPFYALYRQGQAALQFQVSKTSDFSDVPAVDVTLTGNVNSFHYGDVLESAKIYYWRCRYTDEFGNVTDWSTPTTFTTMMVSVTAPIVTAPTGGASTNTEEPTITTTTFQVVGDIDTHQSTDWEIWTGPNGTGTRLWQSLGDTVNKTSIKVPKGVLTRLQTYYPRARYKATKYGYSAWSTGASFYAIWPLRPTVMGQLFQGGYWGGDITYGGKTYSIIVAPKALGEKTATKLTGTLVATPGATSTSDSVADTTALAALIGTNASAAAAFVRGLNIAGYTDWQVPSKDALAVVRTNLRPGATGVPIAFASSGAEAFSTAANYWSSTTYDWSQDGSYTTGGDPIYDTRTVNTNTPHSFSYGPTGETVNYSGYVKCGAGESGPNNVSGPSFSPSGNTIGDPPVRIGYWSASWTCSSTTQQTYVSGYTPTVTHYYTNYYYQAYAFAFGGTANPVATDKTTALTVRAIRLVDVTNAS